MNITVVAVSAIAVGCFTLLGTFTAWLRYRAGREARAGQAGNEQLERLTEELRGVRVTLGALATEVERLGRGQQYSARLLPEPADVLPVDLSTPPGIVTPH